MQHHSQQATWWFHLSFFFFFFPSPTPFYININLSFARHVNDLILTRINDYETNKKKKNSIVWMAMKKPKGIYYYTWAEVCFSVWTMEIPWKLLKGHQNTLKWIVNGNTLFNDISVIFSNLSLSFPLISYCNSKIKQPTPPLLSPFTFGLNRLHRSKTKEHFSMHFIIISSNYYCISLTSVSCQSHLLPETKIFNIFQVWRK